MSKVKSITKHKITDQKLYNLAVLDDESFIANGIVVHNCRSLLIPITEFEEYQIDETVETVDDEGNVVEENINDFIEENKGAGFATK
jgi:hypothetical protein